MGFSLALRIRGLGLVAALAAIPLITASNASASTFEDDVWLNNATSIAFTQESYCVVIGLLPCPLGWRDGDVLAAGQQNPGIEATLENFPDTETGVKFTTTWYPPGGTGGYIELFVYDPFVSPLQVQCYGVNITGFGCNEVGYDGEYAYLNQAGGSPSGGRTSGYRVDPSFWSNLALVRSGVALVPVIGYSNRRHGTVRERVVLRSIKGAIIGSGEKTLQFGKRANLHIRLTPGVAQRVASGKSIRIRASVTNPKGTPGTGYATTLVLTKLTNILANTLPSG